MVGYRRYYWTDQEPIMDELREIKRKEGLTDSQIEKLTWVRAGTMAKWWSRETKTARNSSVEAFVQGLGYVRTIQKKKDINFERELVRAKVEFDAEMKKRAARRNARNGK